MFIFILNDIRSFVDATAIVGGLDNTFELKFSLKMFSTMSRLSRSSDFLIALEMFPPFFDEYYCYTDHYSNIDVHEFYPIIFNLESSGYSSLSFSLYDPHRAFLKFETPTRSMWQVNFPLFVSDESKDVGDFDWSTFVSINTVEFATIVSAMSYFDHVLVTLTNSQIKFTCSRREIILTSERRQCIIGGLRPLNEINFILTFRPMIVFLSMARRARTVWLYKSSNSDNGVICAPLGLDARFLVYVPDMV